MEVPTYHSGTSSSCEFFQKEGQCHLRKIGIRRHTLSESKFQIIGSNSIRIIRRWTEGDGEVAECNVEEVFDMILDVELQKDYSID